MIRTQRPYSRCNRIIASRLRFTLNPAVSGIRTRNIFSGDPDHYKEVAPFLPPVVQDKNLQTPMEMIDEIPPIEWDGDTAICSGGGIAGLGHPTEYIQLNKVNPDEPSICKYCGLRYIRKKH